MGRHKMRSAGEASPLQSADDPSAAGSRQGPEIIRLFKQYTDMVNQEETGSHLRGIMDFNYPEKGMPIDEVESVDSIVTRFKTGAMSYGSISQEAHETLAIAMNHAAW